MKKIILLTIIPILLLISACSSETGVSKFELLNRAENNHIMAYLHDNHWHGSLPHLHEDESLSLGAYIERLDGTALTLDGDYHGFSVRLADDAETGIVELANHGDHVHVNAVGEGSTSLVFEWIHDGEVAYTTPSMTVTVGHSHGHDAEIGAFEIHDRRNENNRLAYVHGDHWHGSLPHLHEDESLSLGAYIERLDGTALTLDGDHHGFTVRLADDAETGIVELVNHGDHVHVNAVGEGSTSLVFEWVHDGEVAYTTPSMTVTVGHND